MTNTILHELASNAALLLVLSFLYVQIYRRWENRKLIGQIINGVLFGGVAIVVMLSPLNLLPGVVFDTRSVVISVGGLFGGPLVAGVSFVMASALRVWQGGAGALMGVLVSFFSAALGAAFYFWKQRDPKVTTAPYLYGFGVLVHLVMLACALALPGEMTWRVLGDIALPVIIIYPVATLLLCLLIAERESSIKADRLLKESEERYRRIVDTSNEGIWMIDQSLRTTFVNARMAAMLGHAPSEMLGRSLADFIMPEDMAKHKSQMIDRRQGTESQYEMRLLRNDGGVLWATVSATPLYEGGQYVGSLAMYTDIGERKRADDLTMARLRLLEASAANSLQDILRLTLDEVCALTGSAIGFYHFVEPDQRTLSLQAWSTRTLEEFCQAQGAGMHYAIDKAGVWVDCVRLRHPVIHNDYASLAHRKGLPPGHAKLVRELVTPIMRKDKIVAILGVGNKSRDYTDGDVDTVKYLADVAWEMAERKRAEEALRLSEEKFSKAFNASPVLVAVTTVQEERFLEVNDAFAAITGFDREESLGHTASELGFWTNQEEDHQRAVRAFLSQGHFRNLEVNMRYRDGKSHAMLWSAEPMEFGGQSCLVNVLVDISEQKEAQDERAKLEVQLRQAQKMEAIGTLAGGIAHDFNNILGAIMGYAELAQEMAAKGRPNTKELSLVLRSAERARDLVRQILTFSRKTGADMRPLSLNKAVRQSLQMLERSLPKMIALETHLAPDLELVNADPTQMEQVIMNLAANAADAMPEGGRLIIETKNIAMTEEYCRQHLELRPGRYVLLMVSDTGHGIAPNVLDHIFDPFFTTKGVGKGTGLGLSSVYGIAHAHGGHVFCYSEPGLGATFKLYLPALGGEAAAPALEVSLPEQILGGAETILLVDDEPTLRELGSHVLELMGYRVLTAQSGEEALELYRARGAEIALVLMDLGMPGMGGHKCLKEILALDPKARVVIASGYSANGQVKASLESGAAGFVPKPFRRLDLLATVRSVLDKD